MTDINTIQVDDFLEHFGVRGMQWGVRKSKSQTGISRARAGTIARNDRFARLSGNIRDRSAGRVLNALSAPDRALMGQARFERYHNRRISTLNAQSDRIRSGNLLVRDRLSIIGTSPIDMLIERTA